MDSYLRSLGYTPTHADPCVYVRPTLDGRRILLSLYVDDTIVAYDRKDSSVWLADKAKLAARYAIKDLGACNWILNMEVKRDRAARSLTLSQEAYVRRMLDAFHMQQCKPAPNPCMTAELTRPQSHAASPLCDAAQHDIYRSIVGSLLYAANQTRLDIAYAVGMLCRAVSQPTLLHLKAARHVLRYLAGTPTLALSFSASHPSADVVSPVVAYADASWANDLGDRRSTTGAVIKLFGNPVVWLSNKQTCVATSTAEAEYVALAATARELAWTRQWLSEVLGKKHCATVYSDSQAAIAIASHDVLHQRTKHIDIAHHYVRDQVARQRIALTWVSTACSRLICSPSVW